MNQIAHKSQQEAILSSCFRHGNMYTKIETLADYAFAVLAKIDSQLFSINTLVEFYALRIFNSKKRIYCSIIIMGFFMHFAT